MTSVLRLENVTHHYGPRRALDAVSFEVRAGEIVSILGPSGCGKSTLLRLVAGLERLEFGSISLAGEVVSRPGFLLPPERRNVGLVFQDYALFPHLSVADNVLFGIAAPRPASARSDAVALLQRVGLATRADSFPHTLSGGEQQRVALVRSLATYPALMLMDEPFAGLDTGLRAAVRAETLDVLKERDCPAVIVTHDAPEAMEISDRIVVLRDGRVEQDAAPSDIYLEPVSAFVARFFGGSSTLRGEVFGPGDVRCGTLHLNAGNARFAGVSGKPGTVAEVLVRPEAVQLVDDDVPNALQARIQKVSWMGETVRVKLAVDAPGGGDVTASYPTWLWHRRFRHRGGEAVRIALEPSGVHVFAASASASASASADGQADEELSPQNLR